MLSRLVQFRLLGGMVAWAAVVAVPLASVHAQDGGVSTPPWRGVPCATCPGLPPVPIVPSSPYMPHAEPTTPSTPTPPTTPTSPSTAPMPNLTPNMNPTEPENAAETPSGQDFGFGGSEGLASGAQTFASPGGYLDDPIPQTMFKLRYDSESGINTFDRADYMFGTWREGSFHTHALVGNGAVRGTFFDPKATGSQIISNDAAEQTLSAAMEYAFSQRLSVFVDVPYQFVHFGPDIEDDPVESKAERTQFPEYQEVRSPNQNPNGLGDVEFGFKYAFVAETDYRYLTFQFRTYVPTGDSGLGLGTGHVSVEPSLLAYQRLTDRTVIQGQLTDWIPINAGPGAGNVVSYGGGVGYDVIQRPKLRVTPVAEVVGWTCLGGTEGFAGVVPGTVVPAVPTGADSINVNGTYVPYDHGFREANGDTIVNLKFGVRTYFGERSDIYAGYGHSVTGDRWYKDIASVEYRIGF